MLQVEINLLLLQAVSKELSAMLLTTVPTAARLRYRRDVDQMEATQVTSRNRYATLAPVLTGGSACLRSRANVARPHTHGLHTVTVALTHLRLKHLRSVEILTLPCERFGAYVPTLTLRHLLEASLHPLTHIRGIFGAVWKTLCLYVLDKMCSLKS